MDLRQLGLLLLITRQDYLPLFHKIYQGNLQDRTVFKRYFRHMVDRLKALSGSLHDIMVVFDQGNNSKEILQDVYEAIHFVGALSPCHHKALVEEANKSMGRISIQDTEMPCYRTHTTIWGLDLTAIVYVSEKLLQGQIRGIEQNMAKLFTKLAALKEKIRFPTKRGAKRQPEALGKKIASLISSYDVNEILHFSLTPLSKDAFELDFWVDKDQLNHLKEHSLGRRILITNRHNWSTEEIILAYWGQAQVEYAFKTLKNPSHLALRPQYHWTDHKVKVHGFICLIAFLLIMVLYKRAKEKANFKGSPHCLLELVLAVRLGTFVESPPRKTKGRYKAVHRIEEMDDDIRQIADGLGLFEKELNTNIPFSVCS